LNSIGLIKSDNPYEKEIVKLLYGGNEEIINYIFDKVGLELFSNQRFKKLAEIVHEACSTHQYSPAYLVDKIEDEELRNFIFRIALTDETISKKWDEISYNGKIEKDTFEYAIHTVTNFLVNQIEQQIKINNHIIEESKDERLHLELLKRNNELQEEKRTLLNDKSGS